MTLAAGLVATAVAAPGPGDVGTPAAEFTLQDTSGQTHTLGGQRGKVVMLAIVGYG